MRKAITISYRRVLGTSYSQSSFIIDVIFDWVVDRCAYNIYFDYLVFPKKTNSKFTVIELYDYTAKTQGA